MICFAESNDTSSDVEQVYINATLDVLGSMHVQEVHVIKGTMDNYKREISYKTSNLPEWEEGKVNLYASSFYDGRSANISKISAFEIQENEINWDLLNHKYAEFKESESYKDGDKETYTKKETDIGYDIEVYNKSDSEYTAYYFDYYVNQVAVLHNDIGELYQTFFRSSDYYVKKIDIQVLLPWQDSEDTFRFWGHGTTNSEIRGISTSKNDEGKVLYKGISATINDYEPNYKICLRMTFDKDGYKKMEPILNKSKMDALDQIVEIENSRNQKANASRVINKTMFYFFLVVDIIYLLGVIILFIYIRKKYDVHDDKKLNINLISILYLCLGILMIIFHVLLNFDYTVFPLLIFISGISFVIYTYKIN